MIPGCASINFAAASFGTRGYSRAEMEPERNDAETKRRTEQAWAFFRALARIPVNESASAKR